MGAAIAGQTTTEDAGSEKRHLAIDGKTLKGSRSNSKAPGPLHLVSVWMSAKGITLAQVPTDAKSNEITAIPQVLELIDVRGSVITIDAMGAQVGIVKAITERGGDVVVCLKGNQLHESSNKKRHGRLESRTYIQFEIPKDFPLEEKWFGLKSFGVVVRETNSAGKHTVEQSFYISSLPVGIAQFSKSIRSHWGIENTCHWSLDVTWREDSLRTTERRMAENLAWIKRFSLSLLKQMSDKHSGAMRRRMCGWSEEYLTQVLIKLGT
jgi:predicted transposase YbfD/YdcC